MSAAHRFKGSSQISAEASFPIGSWDEGGRGRMLLTFGRNSSRKLDVGQKFHKLQSVATFEGRELQLVQGSLVNRSMPGTRNAHLVQSVAGTATLFWNARPKPLTAFRRFCSASFVHGHMIAR